jgi:hypothetical protein
MSSSFAIFILCFFRVIVPLLHPSYYSTHPL